MEYPTNVNVLMVDDFASDEEMKAFDRNASDAFLLFRTYKAPVYAKDFYAAVVQAFGPDATAEALAATRIQGVRA